MDIMLHADDRRNGGFCGHGIAVIASQVVNDQADKNGDGSFDDALPQMRQTPYAIFIFKSGLFHIITPDS